MDQFIRHQRLEGKRAIVTGAAAGLGEAIARMFAREGAAVACLDKNQESNEAVAASILSLAKIPNMKKSIDFSVGS
jgi:NAD(P)-dependent dehydrogenase (short-subunit alcohol dehydrogenase family)